MFSAGVGAVPSRNTDAPPPPEPTFATAAYAEPRDWGYRGLLAFTLVLLVRPQDHVPALNPFHVAEVCAILGIAPMLLHRAAYRVPVFRLTTETLALMAFGSVMLVTVPFSVWPGGALEVFTDQYLKIVIVFVLMMNTLTTPKRIDQLTWLIVVCCGYVALRAVIDYAQGTNLLEQGRVTSVTAGIFGNPNDLALNLVTFLPAAVVFALSPRHSPAKRLVATAVTALMAAAIVFTKSRAGALGLAAVIVSLVLMGRKIRPRFGSMVIVAVLVGTPLAPSSFWSRMQSMFDENVDRQQFTGSSEARRNVMREGIHAFLERPLTGVGLGQFRNYNPRGRLESWRETHNALIQVASETGLFGLIAFTFLIVRAAMCATGARRLLRRSGDAQAARPERLALVLTVRDRRSLYSHTIAMTVGLIGWFVCALFASVAYNWTFYYVLALMVAPRELVRDRLAAASSLAAPMTQAHFIPAAAGAR